MNKKRYDLGMHFCTDKDFSWSVAPVDFTADFFFNENYSFGKSFNSFEEIKSWAEECLPVLKDNIRTSESKSYIKDELIEAFNELEEAINYEEDYNWTMDGNYFGTYINLEVITEETVMVKVPLELYDKICERNLKNDELICALEEYISKN